MKARPNLLLFFPDQQRADWIGGVMPALRSPNLGALRARGTTFLHAVTPCPLCAPARACLASGMEYENCGVPSNGTDFPAGHPTMYTMLRDAGYTVMGCGKFDLHKASFTWGLDGSHLLEEWGFSAGVDSEGKWDGVHSGADEPRGPYLHYLEQVGWRQAHLRDFDSRRSGVYSHTYPTPLPDEHYCDNWIGRTGLELLSRIPRGDPWFLQVNFAGPHEPMDVTRSMKALYDGVDFPLPVDNGRDPPETHREIRRNYAAIITNIDRWIGMYLQNIEERGEADHTLVVYSSDHGDMLGDHGLWGKSQPYSGSVSVPLVLAGCGLPAGIAVSEPATNLDLTATFLEIAGVQAPLTMDSRSLIPVAEGRSRARRRFVRSGFAPRDGKGWRMVYDGRRKLIRYADGSVRLFDLEQDPGEMDNRAEREPGRAAALERLLEVSP